MAPKPEAPRTETDAGRTDAGARRRMTTVALARLTDRVARTAMGKRGFTDAAIVARWPQIVGADLAAFACPMQVKYPKGRNDGATLLLRVSSSAAAAMLQLKTPQIVARVNQFFGYAAVARLEASHGPLPKAMPKPRPVPEPVPSPDLMAQTAAVASEDLRNALRKLGAHLQHRAGTSVVSPADSSRPGNKPKP